MHKLMSGAIAALFFTAACSGTPGTGSGSPVLTIPPSAVGAAQAQLCSETGDASLTGLATKLEGFDPATMDTTEFQVAAGVVATTLASLQVSAEQVILRDAAVTAVQSVQGATVDKATTTQAATAIRALDTAIC